MRVSGAESLFSARDVCGQQGPVMKRLIAGIGIDSQMLSIQVARIENPEDLRECTRGSDLDVVPLAVGKLHGALTHFGVASLSMTLGQFSSGIRTKGLINQDKVTLGLLMSSAGRVSQWWRDVEPGDVSIFPPGAHSDAIYSGGASYLAISITPSDLMLWLRYEDRLADPPFWNVRNLRRVDPIIGDETRRRLTRIITGLQRKTSVPSPQAADFLQRSITEAFLTNALHGTSDNGRSRCTGARLVSEAENYMDAAGGRPVHISELWSALKASRRTLHRAFVDTLNMGPIAYLRRRRLTAIHTILKRADFATIAIADVAFEHGFFDPGRFSGYYRSLFGEAPSETRRSALALQGFPHRPTHSTQWAQTA